MREILLVKTSSMGDVIHALPALTDAWRHDPTIRFDWVVEAGFAEIPRWHPAVDRVIPITLRQMKKSGFRWSEIQKWISAIRGKTYDHVIDAQGLLKSVILSRLAKKKGSLHGFSASSLRAKGIAWLYDIRHDVPRDGHAIDRQRELFSKSLGYSLPEQAVIDAGIRESIGALSTDTVPSEPYLVFAQGTSWHSKGWPDQHWRTLAKQAGERGLHVYVTSGSPLEHERAIRISQDLKNVFAPPPGSLTSMAVLMAHARAVVSVDTGLGHLGSALGIPLVALYGPTDPGLTGIKNASILFNDFSCRPCFQSTCVLDPEAAMCMQTIGPQAVWEEIQQVIPK